MVPPQKLGEGETPSTQAPSVVLQHNARLQTELPRAILARRFASRAMAPPPSSDAPFHGQASGKLGVPLAHLPDEKACGCFIR